MESRMRGNSHVRFGAGDGETCLGNEARRFIPTLPDTSPRLSLSREMNVDVSPHRVCPRRRPSEAEARGKRQPQERQHSAAEGGTRDRLQPRDRTLRQS